MKFPIESFPLICRDFIEDIPRVVGGRPEYAGLSILYAASIIGAECHVVPKPGWKLPLSIYAAIVAEKGSSKSPVMKAIFGSMIKKFASDANEWQKLHGEWKKKVLKDKSFDEPEPKMPWWGIITDGTVEGIRNMALRHHENGHPPHMGRFNDELDGWVKSMNQYKGEGGDMAFYLQAHDGDYHVKVNKGEQSSCPLFTLSIMGSIQRSIFRDGFEGNNTQNGLLDRFVVVTQKDEIEVIDPDPFEEWGQGVKEDYERFIKEMMKDRPCQGYDFPENCRDIARGFNDYCKLIDQKYKTGAIKKWWQQYFKVCALLAILWSSDVIDKGIAEKADNLMRYLVFNFCEAFKDLQKSDTQLVTEKIVEFLKENDELSERDIKRKLSIKLRGSVGDIIEDLVERGMLIERLNAPKKGGRQTKKFSLAKAV
jgi:hypothetical protein